LKDHFSFRNVAALERRLSPGASQVVFLNEAYWFSIGDDPKAFFSDTIQFHLNPPAIRKRNWRASNAE
jgi:hypothetical protein